MSLNGIDISRYQVGIDLKKVPGDFVIMKSSQGTSLVSSTLKDQYNNAVAANKLIGFYHYAGGGGATNEIDFFVNTIKTYIGNNAFGKYIMCIDWEKDSNPNFGNYSYVEKMLSYFKEKTGVTPFLYMSKSVARESGWKNTKVPGNYPLWIAQYKDRNESHGYQVNPWTDSKGIGSFDKITIYQYSSRTILSGYSGVLDVDIAYMTKADWAKYASVYKKEVAVGNTYKITANILNIRKKPTSSSEDIGDLIKNSVITVDKVENGFAHFEGWVSTKWIE